MKNALIAVEGEGLDAVEDASGSRAVEPPRGGIADGWATCLPELANRCSI